MRVALVYDRVNKWGGAERVLMALHEVFPKAPLYTSVYHKSRAKWASAFDIKTSFLQKIPKASSSHECYALLMPFAFESFSFENYDVVISVTSESAKGIVTPPGVLHVCYCLTPTRYLWSGYKDYFQDLSFRIISKPAISYLRSWDKVAAQRPDAYIAISKEVQSRIKKYYMRDSIVIYPPLTLENSEQLQFNIKNSDYFLIVSRLVPYKKIDLIVHAFNQLKLPLKIIGTGSEEKKLKKLAKSNVKFLRDLTDEQLLGYYKGCKALIFSGREDFGLSILEAQSLGKPVIAFKEGGATEIVVEGKTGLFFYPQKVESLVEAVKRFNNFKFNAKDCIIQAKRFNKERFKKQFLERIEKLFNNHKKI